MHARTIKTLLKHGYPVDELPAFDSSIHEIFWFMDTNPTIFKCWEMKTIKYWLTRIARATLKRF